ncbi:MAG: hypothetical protein Nk1A_7040 [Endomicrobiia bacterium]|nr:MAG: hypothetical protein Nk1A_7040 [Endomicrobiia bacterium]
MKKSLISLALVFALGIGVVGSANAVPLWEESMFQRQTSQPLSRPMSTPQLILWCGFHFLGPSISVSLWEAYYRIFHPGLPIHERWYLKHGGGSYHHPRP